MSSRDYEDLQATAVSMEMAPLYRPIESGLDIKEAYHVQTASGNSRYDVALATDGQHQLLRARSYFASIAVGVLHPHQTGYYVPLSDMSGCHVNGEAASNSAIYTPGDLDSVHVRGGPRESLVVVLQREELVQTLAALRGIGPEDLQINERVLTMHDGRAADFRRRISALFDTACDGSSIGPGEDPFQAILALICDVHLFEWTEPRSNCVQGRRPEQIVRKAEEHFMEVSDRRTSLADLCAAAGVGKSRLYQAFQHVCGEPPLSYFHRRRLMQVRSALMETEPERGAVKRIALEAGTTSLGRFSVEYRRFFGESPTTTLATRMAVP